MNESKLFYITKRFQDITLSVICLFILSIPLIMAGLIIKITSKGPVLYWSKRIGKDNKVFLMVKLRTMRNDTPELASNTFKRHERYYIFLGKILRKVGIDEIPQFYNVIKGEMSIVGPRPALHNFKELIKLREQRGINLIKPGLTGIAQIYGRDNLTTKEKVLLDNFYYRHMNILLDIKIIIMTVLRVFVWDSKYKNKSKLYPDSAL